MKEPAVGLCRHSDVTTRAALLILAAFTLASCSGSSSSPTRLVGAHRVALAVPADWKTSVERGSFCAPTNPRTVQFFTPLHPGEGVGSCAIPNGASWPAENSVSIYTKFSGGVRTPHGAASGKVAGMPYYISDSRQSGPGVALTLTLPRAGVAFLVGATTRDAGKALLATVRYVPAGTPLR